MDLTLLIAFWGIIALLAAVPGADWAFLISASLRGRGGAAVLGMVAGHLAIAVATALGLAALVGARPWVTVVIGVGGGLALLRLGASALAGVLEDRRVRTAAEAVLTASADAGCQPGDSGECSGAQAGPDGGATVAPATTSGGAVAVRERASERARTSSRATMLQGASVSLLNPKVYLLFLTLVPQFVSAASPLSDTVQLLVLGGMHVATCALIYWGVVRGAGSLLLGRPRLATGVSAASGVVLIILGVTVIVEPLLSLG